MLMTSLTLNTDSTVKIQLQNTGETGNINQAKWLLFKEKGQKKACIFRLNFYIQKSFVFVIVIGEKMLNRMALLKSRF